MGLDREIDDLDDFIENSLIDIFISCNEEIESFERPIWEKIEANLAEIQADSDKIVESQVF